jgi:hypothetical protein
MRTWAITVSIGFLLSIALATDNWAKDKAGPKAGEVATLAKEAYIFGYPLVLMDVSRQVMTACPSPEPKCAPLNQFAHLREFPDPAFTEVVSPNADTLYSSAWLDLAKGPMVLSVPVMKNRYYLMQLLDAWTNVFASVGTRTTGSGQGDFAIVGPDWKGAVPPNLKKIKAPTDMVWLLGRTQTNGKSDYPAVHALQNKYRLTPLSAWGRPYTPPAAGPVHRRVDKAPPAAQVEKMDAITFFTRMCALMRANPPAARDAGTLKKFAALGIVPGRGFNTKRLVAAARGALDQGVAKARQEIAAAAKQPKVRMANGWGLAYDLGAYGTRYLDRAAIAMMALGANLPQDAIYPMTRVDSAGQPLSGKYKYVLHFPKGQLPPVKAFWSVTMYNNQQFFVANPLNRYALGDRDRLQFNPDGSLDLYIQHDSPGKAREANWLPAPAEGFNLIMRLYWPKEQVLDGAWVPPAVQRAPQK